MIMDCIKEFGASKTLEAIKLRQIIAKHNSSCEMSNGVVIGGWYRHFKGSFAQVLCLAKHSETDDYLVIYKCLGNGDSDTDTNHKDGVYARPIKMFLSPVNKGKYPKSIQAFRFELITDNTDIGEGN